ncbi:response regulator [bacterium]|jgi:DNA-binding response OmpR family regulator|nr:response regulator [bacterium]MBT4122124.1 response regulator [bacterium]MBT4335196.1 response regulator [bacterium]MBT4495982.1 response regulator [bacterium]MBT4763500.1 response regulator [bacterium]
MVNNHKILIVEDDSFLIQMYSSKLEIEGYKVILASDGEKALRIIKEKKPDLILLDLLLPKLNGFEFLEKLKSENMNIPVIVLSNLSQKEDIDKCLDLGAKDFLIKAHFVPSEVIIKIKKVLENF